MKKIAIIISIVTITAVAGTAWRIHLYNQEISRTAELENAALRMGFARSAELNSGRQRMIAALESRLKTLTNEPADVTKNTKS